MARAFGLPGNRGQKAYNYYVTGHAHATTGKPRRNLENLSKACAKSYEQGYQKGLDDKETK